MTDFLVVGFVLASWIFCYWLGWRDANEQRQMMDNLDRLCALASADPATPSARFIGREDKTNG